MNRYKKLSFGAALTLLALAVGCGSPYAPPIVTPPAAIVPTACIPISQTTPIGFSATGYRISADSLVAGMIPITTPPDTNFPSGGVVGALTITSAASYSGNHQSRDYMDGRKLAVNYISPSSPITGTLLLGQQAALEILSQSGTTGTTTGNCITGLSISLNDYNRTQWNGSVLITGVVNIYTRLPIQGKAYYQLRFN